MKTRHTAAALIALGLSTNSALAVGLTCATFGTQNIAPGGFVNVTVDAGDTFTVSNATLNSSVFLEVKPANVTDSCTASPVAAQSCVLGNTLQAGAAGTATVEVTGPVAVDVTCSAGTLGGGGGGGGVTPTTAQGAQQSVGGAGSSAVAASSAAISGAISSSLGGSGTIVNRNQIFIATKGMAGSTPRAWATLQGSNLSGNIDGSTTELTLGVDFAVGSNGRAGLLASIGQSDLNTGLDVDIDAFTFGAYFQTELSGGQELTGWFAVASPDYEISGTTTGASRRMFGMTYASEYALGNVDLTSWASLTGAQEKIDAYTLAGIGAVPQSEVERYQATLGSRFTFMRGADLRPFVSLALDAASTDIDGVEDSFVAPRFGTGFSYDTGAGRLDMHLNAGHVMDDTTDVNLQFNYSLNF